MCCWLTPVAGRNLYMYVTTDLYATMHTSRDYFCRRQPNAYCIVFPKEKQNKKRQSNNDSSKKNKGQLKQELYAQQHTCISSKEGQYVSLWWKGVPACIELVLQLKRQPLYRWKAHIQNGLHVYSYLAAFNEAKVLVCMSRNPCCSLDNHTVFEPPNHADSYSSSLP